jgi:hydrogenase nickel incorporation protein HypB
MCATCGCSDNAGVELSLHEHDADGGHSHLHGAEHAHLHPHSHAHVHAEAAQTLSPDSQEHRHDAQPMRMHYRALGDLEAGARYGLGASREHRHDHDMTVPGRDLRTVELEAQILGKNQLIAERNRGWLAGRGILALNLVSSPGAGKTTLLERTLNDLKQEHRIAVVEGDQATANDAQRIRATGVRAVQINTGTGCHLEADMLERALAMLKPELNSLLLVENIGNLVCPALFDLGERAKVVIFSVTEGEDKPLKYPHMFRAAAVMILSKTDLLPHVRFDVERAVANARTVNPRLTVLPLSAYSGEGMAEWYGWLKTELAGAAYHRVQ